MHDSSLETLAPWRVTAVASYRGVVAFSIEASKVIVEETELFKITVSFGSVTSLISLPCFMSHASIPAEVIHRARPQCLQKICSSWMRALLRVLHLAICRW